MKKAWTPRSNGVRKALQAYQNANAKTLTSSHRNAIVEIFARLRKIDAAVVRLMQINNRLLEMEGLRFEFNEELGILTEIDRGVARSFQFQRADPNVPVTFSNYEQFQTFVSGEDRFSNPESQALCDSLEAPLEDCYTSAHRLVVKIKELPKLGAFRCPEISKVRNKLIEHPGEGALYSFGFGTRGPLIKPLWQKKLEWADAGLQPNIEAFYTALESALRDAIES